jgi:5-methylcytosine-specific restriction protein A
MPGRWVGSTRAQRLPPGWSTRIVPRILARDRGVCYLCGYLGADTVDHVNPGDDHSDANLAAVHDANPPHCHRHKSAAEGNAARWKAREKRPPERHPGLT